ncbi:MAG: FG-GAP-like repeat-containing protein, partial [Terracidiphilus sp.]
MHNRIFRTSPILPLCLAILTVFSLGLSAAGLAFGMQQDTANDSSPSLATRPVPYPVRFVPGSLRPNVATISATTTTLTLSASTVNAGTAVTLTAHVVSGATAVAPGILLFCNATYPVCTGPAVLASAVLNSQGSAARTLMLPAGTYSIVASFQGTTPYAASSSAAQSLTVEGDSNYATKATLTSASGSKGAYAVGASLASHGVTAPTGSLVFTDATDNRTLGSVALGSTPLGGYQPFGLISTGSKSGPNDLAMGDFNGDGIPDLVVPDSATGAVRYSTGSGSKPLAVAVGDFNGDGKLDLAVALGDQAAVALLMGNGDGTFQTERTVATAGSALYYPVALTVADFNHDGRLDIATANNSVGASILLGNGDGTFQPYKLLGSSKGPTWIAAGDFNGDGKPDLAVTTSANTVDISLGNGDGSFQTFTPVATGTGTTPESVALADLDGDGNLDLVVACYGANAVGVLLGNGDGTFLPIELYAAGDGPIAVTTGDLNLDGIPDLVVTDLTGNGLSLFEGNGDGTFLPLPGYSTTSGSEPAASVVADLNADGTPEIVSVLYESSALYVLQTGRIQGALLKDISLSTTGTINLTAAYAGDSLYAPATSAAYAFTGSSTTAAAPAFSPVAGTYAAAQTVTLSSTTSGAKIYYTLDGTTPTTASSLYSSALAVKSSTTLSAIAVATGFTNSSVATAAYIIENPAATPTFSPGAGKYTGTQSVALASTTAGATIYYTVNGSTPTSASVKYTG